MSTITSAGNGGSRSLTIVKQYFKKPMTLIVAILSLATIAANFMLSTASAKVAEQITTALNMANEGQNSGGIIIGYIVSGVVTLCLFMIFVSSISPNGGPTLWFNILHKLSVLELILCLIGTIIMAVIEIVFIFSTQTIVSKAVENGFGGMGEMTEEQLDQINRMAEVYRTSFIVLLVITLIVCAVTIYYVNSQTAFLKSVLMTCQNPQLKSRGAVPYGNLSIFIGILILIMAIISYLTSGNADMNVFADMDIEMPIDFSIFNTLQKPILIYYVTSALYILLRGYFAKGWDKHAKENEQSVYETPGAGQRHSDASPMPTYKANTRNASEARQQSQPYLIGEEENPNKKSSYIPEELQQDYNEPQMYGAPGGQPQFGGDPYGNPYGGNPYGGAPFGQQGGQQPFGGDPFAQSPMGGSNPYGGGNPYGGNPYGGGNPNDPMGGGYNNGMM